MSELYRGVIVINVILKDEYGNPVPGKRVLHTTAYSRLATAKGQATILAKRYKNLDEVFMERATEWTRVD